MGPATQVWRSGAVLAAAGLLVLGCSSKPQAPEAAPPPQAPAPTATATSASPAATRGPATPADKRAVRETVDALRDYLTAWAADGAARASRYLVADMRVTSDQGMPKLASGSLTSYDISSWQGPTRFTLIVKVDLDFDGSPYAWNRGLNTRFVTPHRQGPHGRTLLALASSP